MSGQGKSNLNVGRGAFGDGIRQQGVERLDLGAGQRRRLFAEKDGAEVDLRDGQLRGRHRQETRMSTVSWFWGIAPVSCCEAAA